MEKDIRGVLKRGIAGQSGKRLLPVWLLCLVMVTVLPISSVKAAEAEESAVVNADCSIVGHDFVGERCNRCGAVEKRMPEGAGSKADPYQIGKVSELYWFAGLVNGDEEVCTGDVKQNKAACAVLTADITVNAGVLDNEGNLTSRKEGLLEWTPIGNAKAIYDSKATFDGQGHCIRGLYCNRSDANYVGLFGYTKGKIKNVGVEDVYMVGNQWVGGIFGSAPGGSVSNCYATGTMAGKKYVGGLGGSIANKISGSYSIARSADTGSGLAMGGNFSLSSKFDQCYYGPDVCSEKDGITYASSEEFASGKVAYLLQQSSAGLTVWGQNLTNGGDTHPVFDMDGSRQVYQTNGCVTYSNDPKNQGREKKHSAPENGICPDCGALVEEQNVPYLNEQGETQKADHVQDVEDTTIEWKGTEAAPAWYVVKGAVSIKERIKVSGKVYLILTDGCSLEAEKGMNVAAGNSLTIYAQSIGEDAGTLTATGDDGAGIGGGRSESSGEITICGGIIKATGESGAGIGGGREGAGGVTTIRGGMVTATGERGAGIGGGWSGASGKITILGGTVNATGNDGAGIGGGYSGAGEEITIRGGIVKATGEKGAGIGGGYEKAGGEITIYGGIINAIGGRRGAGIGGGHNGAGGKVTICGGVVTATGDGGAGIGGGYNGGAGNFQTQTDEESASEGKAIIFATSISDTSGKGSWNGLIAYGDQGGFYGTMTEAVIEESATIPAGRKLTIEDGKTLTIKQGATFTNNGTLEAGSGGSLVNQGTFTNAGTIEIASSGSLVNRGTLTNDGTIEIASGGSLVNQGTIANNGTLTVTDGGSFDNSEGTFKQNGTYNDQNGESAGETPGTVQKCLTISNITVENKEYDGTDSLKVTGVTLRGVDAGDDVSVQKVELSAVLDSSQSGTYQQIKSLEGNVILAGKDAEKYYVDLVCDSSMSVNDGNGVKITKNTKEITKTVADKSYLSIRDHSDTINISRLSDKAWGSPVNTAVKVLDEKGMDIQETAQWTAEVDSEYRLHYTIKAGESGKRRLVAVVETQNYSHIEFIVDITLVPRYKVQVKEGSKVTTDPDGITYGQSLTELAFMNTVFTDESGNVVPGTLSWKNPSHEPKGSETTAEWIFTPLDNSYDTLAGETLITVNKQEPQITKVPVAVNELTYGQKLSEAVLTGGSAANAKDESMPGTFSWKNLDQIPTAVDSGKPKYTVIFQPEDTENYKESEAEIAVTVKKADKAPNMPETTKTVPYTIKTVEDTPLPENWKWQTAGTNQKSLLEVGVPFNAVAEYAGSDKGNYEIESATITITRRACTHDTMGLRNEKEATCTQNGYSGDICCAICGVKMESGETIQALGHSYAASQYIWDTSMEGKVNCTAVKKCIRQNCNEEETGHCVSETVTATAEVTKAATCTEKGTIIYTAIFTLDGFTTQTKTDDIAAIDHRLTEVKAKEATAIEVGNKAYFVCNDCGKYFEDSEGKTEITDKSSVIIPVKREQTVKPNGTKIKDSAGATYKVTNAKSNTPTVQYITPKRNAKGTITIPENVTIDGVTYKVTSIADNAFKGNKKIKKIVIGSNIVSIGKKAFANCTNLTSITIGKNVTKIGKSAFSGCKKLKSVIIKSKKLTNKSVVKGAFSGISKKTVVKVPKSKYKAYKKLLQTKGLSKKVEIKK